MPGFFHNSLLMHKLSLMLMAWSGYNTIAEMLVQFCDLQIFLAGGSIRNMLLDRPSRDFDFFVSEDSISAILPYISERGEVNKGALGSPCWFPRGGGASCDFVPIERVNHGLGHCKNIEDVLGQFDFTGNAIAFDLRTHRFFDPHGGVSDLKRRSMRAVRFDFPETPVLSGVSVTWSSTRWFRILHYAAILGLQIEPATLNWLRENHQYIRYRDDFTELFFAPCLDLVHEFDLAEGLRI